MNSKEESGMTSFTGLGSLDPVVDLLIDQGDRRQTGAHLPKVERTRKRKSANAPSGENLARSTWTCHRT